MSYRLRTLLKVSLGLALALAVGVYAYFGVYQQKKTEIRRDLEQALIFQVDKRQITRLELERSSGQKAAVERGKGGDWRLVLPVEGEADPLEVEGLLSTFGSMMSKHRLPAEKLARYGLEQPRAIWRLGLADGSNIELHVGKTSSYNQDLYALRSDQPEQVLVLESYLAPQLMRRGSDLRQRSLLPLKPEQIGRLELSLGSEVFLLERQGTMWQIRKPIQDRADQQRVRRLLNLLGKLRASRFIDGEKKLGTYGLEAPAVRVKLARQGEADWSYDFAFGHGTLKVNEKRVFALRRQPAGPLVEVQEHVLAGFQVKPFGLQAKKPMDFESGRVKQIKISGAGGLLVLERNENKDTAWSLVAPLPGPAKSYKVLSMLESLRRIRAKRFLAEPDEESLVRYGLDSPDLGVWLMDEKGSEISSLSIGKAVDGGVAVLGSQRPLICLVPEKSLEGIPRDAEDLALKPTQKP